MQPFAQVTIGGHLGGDAEVRYTQAGKAMLTFNVAVGWKKRRRDSDEYDDKTMWYRVSLMGNKAEQPWFQEALVKGAAVVVQGRLQADLWIPGDDRDPRQNLDLFANEVWLADRREDRDQAEGQGQPRTERAPAPTRTREQYPSQETRQPAAAAASKGSAAQPMDDLEDLPF